MNQKAPTAFPASYDTTTKIITAVVLIILVVAVAGSRSVVVAGLAAAVFSLSYAYSPRRYLLSERFVTVHRLIGNVSIPLDEIREIRKAG